MAADPTPITLRAPGIRKEDGAEFSQWRRRRMLVPRVLLFLIVGMGFAMGPLLNGPLLHVAPDLESLLLIIELAIVMPAMAAAAALTWFKRDSALTRAVQSVAVVIVVGAALLFRYFALEGHMVYPAQMSGLIVISLAMFGGFNWWRIAVLSLGYLVISCVIELRGDDFSQAAVLAAYAGAYIALIAIAGSVTHDFLMRYTWSELTRLRRTRTALHESESRFHAFMDHSPFIAWIKDAQRRYVYRNQGHRDRYGEPGADWMGRTDAEYFSDEAAKVYQDTDERVLKTGEPLEFETVNLNRDGTATRWLIQKFPVRDDGGRLMVAGIGIDIGERRKLEEKLLESEARFQTFMDNSPSVAWMKDEEGRLVYVNRALREFLGVSPDGWQGTTDFDYFPEKFAKHSRDLDQQTLLSGAALHTEGVAQDAMGSLRHWLLVRFPFVGPAGRKYIGGVATDLTERKRAEELIRMQALTDELTGHYNRRGFATLAEQEMKSAARLNLRCALLYVDLDGLKRINQEFGHAGGDAAIVAVGEALRVAVRRSDIIARVGGDEFVVFAAGVEDMPAFQQRILESIGSYSRTAEVPFELSATVGIAQFDPADGESLERHMLIADQAMFARKKAVT